MNGSNQQQNNYQMDGASIVSYTGVGGVTEGGSRGAFGIPEPRHHSGIPDSDSRNTTPAMGETPVPTSTWSPRAAPTTSTATAFEYFRNTVLNASRLVREANGVTSGAAQACRHECYPNANRLLNQNQYGGIFGGPVKKDKLFFFVAYQGTSQKNGESGYGSISTLLPALPAGSGTPGARGTCPSRGKNTGSSAMLPPRPLLPQLRRAVCWQNRSECAAWRGHRR